MKYFINSEIKGYDSISDVELMSWNDLISFRRHILCKLEFDSMSLIIKEMNKFKDYTPLIPVSMGKDSMITCYLVRKLYPDTKAIFNNTSLDCADTYRMVKHFPNCEIMNPEKGFYQYVKSDNMIPTRFSRFCCRIFKVGVMVSKLDHKHPYLMYMGMRNEESNTRSGYEDEWTNTSEWGNTNWQGILPIRKWSELDVWLYTLWKGIEINPKYRKGYSKLFEIKQDPLTDEEINFKLEINKPETLKEAYDKGFLVKRSNIFHGSIESEITKDGWRIHKGYSQDWGINRTPNYTTVTCSKVYRSYDEAQKEVDEHIAEYKRQAALSDYDWSVEQIDKVLSYYKNIYNLTDSEVKQYRDWILAQDDIENVEVRIHFGNLEFRDCTKHKKWHGIETNM